MHLLVTGGLGFIGSNFIRFWLSAHPRDRITNLDKLTYAANPANLSDIKPDSTYQFIQGDICDQSLVNSLMPGIDLVVHFAAESHVDRSLIDPASFIRTNVIGTQVLLESALKHQILRFHHVSTDEVFGALDLETTAKFNELTRYDPRSPYSASKAASDHLVNAYHHSFGLPVTITNCSNNYGPYQSPEKFIPRLITNLLLGQKVPVYGDGLYVRDWLYVEDHCRAIESVLQKGQVGQTYCVGGMTENISNIALVKTILKLMDLGEDKIEFIKDRPGHDRRYAVDWTKINRQLGWSPRYNLTEAFRLTIDWYRKNPDWWQAAKLEAEKFYSGSAK